jgi:hypothetical protein
MCSDASAGAQHVTGDRQFMRGCADIAGGVMEDEVFKMNQFAIDPQRGATVGEILTLEEAHADRGSGNSLVETRQSDTGVESRPHQGIHADFRELVSR